MLDVDTFRSNLQWITHTKRLRASVNRLATFDTWLLSK
jgi:hypothetical protein